MSLREEGDDSRCFPYLLLIHCSQRYEFIRFTPQVFTLIHKTDKFISLLGKKSATDGYRRSAKKRGSRKMVETCFPNQHESRPFSYGNKSIGCSCGAVEKRWRIHKIPLHPTDEIEKTSFKGASNISASSITGQAW